MDKAERTRQFILEKTASIFNMKGYAGTSLSDLTEATGLTKGSIYGNFANKDEVALAAFDYNLSLLNTTRAALMANSSGAVDKLLTMAGFYRADFKSSMIAGGCPILNTAIEADDTHPLLKEKVSKAIKAWKKNIETLVSQGIAQKEIKKSVNADSFATSFIALIEGGIMMSKVTGNRAMLDNCIDHLEKMIRQELKA